MLNLNLVSILPPSLLQNEQTFKTGKQGYTATTFFGTTTTYILLRAYTTCIRVLSDEI